MKHKEIKIYNLIVKILDFYDNKKEISLHKLVFIIYLCDWKNSIEYGKQITEIKWKHFQGDFADTIAKSFKIGEVSNNKFSFENTDENIFTNEELTSIKMISDLSLKLSTEEFVKLVFSTFPMMIKEKDSVLDLPDLASQYKEEYDFLE